MTGTRDVVRMAFLDVSRLLREMLTPVFEAAFVVETTGEFTDPDALISALPVMGPDVVLIGPGRSGTEEVARRCLAAAPKLSVVTLTRGGRDALAFRLDSSPTTIEDISPELLSEIVHETAKARCRPGL
jgi:DNA-binding NarL/FixJ family response regulator